MSRAETCAAQLAAPLDPIRRERAREDLRRVHSVLVTAELADHPAERYLAAHRAALGVAATLIGLYGRGARLDGSLARGRQDAWAVVARIAPEYAEWAAFFAATRAVLEAARRYCTAPRRHGAGPVTARAADDMVREAGRFADLVRTRVEVRVGARGGEPR